MSSAPALVTVGSCHPGGDGHTYAESGGGPFTLADFK